VLRIGRLYSGFRLRLDDSVHALSLERDRADMVTVLFACVQNAGRSQMAAALFNAAADRQKASAISAGTRPAARVHQGVVEAMNEIGISLSDAAPQRLTPDISATASWLITMGCGEECPFVPGVKVEDWPLPDPHGAAPAEIRAIRDDIASRVRDFVRREGWDPD
jgi:arsenate reductase (thioredoxin)